jgi:hypothetical protein
MATATYCIDSRVECPTQAVTVSTIAHKAVPATTAHHVTPEHLPPWTQPSYSQQT